MDLIDLEPVLETLTEWREQAHEELGRLLDAPMPDPKDYEGIETRARLVEFQFGLIDAYDDTRALLRGEHTIGTSERRRRAREAG